MVNPFLIVMRAFIDAFGITHPSKKQEARATWVISTMLGLIVLGAALFLVALHGMSER